MELEKYFDFQAPDDIRLKGSRIGIESVLYEYIYREQLPDSLATRFPTLSLDQIYATILYYLNHRKKMDAYMKDWLTYGQRMRSEQEENPPPVVVRLQALKAKRQKSFQAL